MRAMLLAGLAFALFHLVRAAWAFAAGRPDPGTVFDAATALLPGAAVGLAWNGHRRAARAVCAPVVLLKGLEALHAIAHLRAHGWALLHAASFAMAVVLAAGVVAASARLRPAPQ